MPGVLEVLEETMLFTAARGAGKELSGLYVHPRDPIEVPEPRPTKGKALSLDTIRKNPIWHWKHDPQLPAVIDDVTVRHRDMNYHPMRVLDRIEFEDVVITDQDLERSFTLPIQERFVAAKFFLPRGKIPDAKKGLWRLESEVDASLLLVLGYQLVGGAIQPLTFKEMAELGDALMPPEGASASPYACTIDGAHAITAKVCVPRFLVALSLTCGMERNDCEPGEILGAARLWPQVMVMSNVRLGGISAPIHLSRPPKTDHAHHEEMERDVQAVYFADTNRDPRGWKADVPLMKNAPPLPYWDNIFDYYDLEPFKNYKDKKPDPFGEDPKQLEKGEVCFVDARMHKEAMVVQAIQRAAYPSTIFTTFQGYLDGAYEEPEVFTKARFQGEFDNVHIATRMRVEFPFGDFKVDPKPARTLKGVTMAPFCVHDCFHTHLRWGDIGITPPKSNTGFDDAGNPYSMPKAPLVPRNHSVFVRLTAPHAMRYRGFAHRPLAPGRWQVFNHHGSYYAIAPWPEDAGRYWGLHPGKGQGAMDGAMAAVDLVATHRNEPFTDGRYGALPFTSFAGFYWRLRFTGRQGPHPNGTVQHIIERLKVLDLDKCRHGMGGLP